MNIRAIIRDGLRKHFERVPPGFYRVGKDGQVKPDDAQAIIDGIVRHARQTGCALREGWRIELRREDRALCVFTVAPDGTEHDGSCPTAWVVLS